MKNYWSKEVLENNVYNNYKKAQIERCINKINNKRNPKYYEDVNNKIKQFKILNESMKMICMGSRNNWEKNCFKKYLKLDNIYDLDICPQSNYDYTYDFQKLPESFINKWDIIYTNSLDHSIDAENTLNHWYPFLKKDGILVIGYEVDFQTPAMTDCTTFTKDSMIKPVEKKYSIIDNSTTIEYLNLVLNKKC